MNSGNCNPRTANIIRNVVVALLLIGIIASIIALFVKLDRQTNIVTIGGESYSIGAIDESGKITDSDASIYLRKAVTTEGLKCELKQDAKIKYRLYFYDKDGGFLSASEELQVDFDGNVPKGAESVRVVITPIADGDGEISVIEILGYADQLIVTVKK